MRKQLKKWILLSIMLCGINQMYAQSWGNIFNKAKKEVLGKTTITEKKIVGSWVYNNAACELDGDGQMDGISGSIASLAVEEKMNDYFQKIGIISGIAQFVFKEDGTFSNILKDKTLTGTYTLDLTTNNITFIYDLAKLKGKAFTTHVSMSSNNELKLLFNAKKLADLASKVADYSKNTTLQLASSLANEYEEILLGVNLTRKQ